MESDHLSEELKGMLSDTNIIGRDFDFSDDESILIEVPNIENVASQPEKKAKQPRLNFTAE